MLEVQSTTKGVLIPRLTDTQRKNLKTPATGLIIYNTTSNRINLYNGTASNGGPGWMEVPSYTVSSPVVGGSATATGVSISTTQHAADQSAMLDVFSTTQGVLIPRTTTAAVTSPVKGIIIFNSSTNNINWYDGSAWQSLCLDKIDNTTGGAGASSTGVAIGMTQTSPTASAILDVSATAQGIRIPILTTAQRDAIQTPAQGLTVYVDGTAPEKRIETWDGSNWNELVNYAPSAVGSITGFTQVCAGQTGATYAVPSVKGASTYSWTYSGSGFTCTANCNTASITASFSAGATSGTLTVTASNGCGTSTASQAITIGGPTAPTAASFSYTSTVTSPFSCATTASTEITNNISLMLTGGSGSTVKWYTGACGGTGTLVGTGNPLSLAVPASTTTYYGLWSDGCGNVSTCQTTTAGPVFDGTHSYTVVNIGSQTWLAQNLDYGTTRVNGGVALTAGQKWCYGNSLSACDNIQDLNGYGVLPLFPMGALYSYTYAVNTGSGSDVCNTALGGTWHVSTDAEWCTMELSIGAGDIYCNDSALNVPAGSLGSPYIAIVPLEGGGNTRNKIENTLNYSLKDDAGAHCGFSKGTNWANSACGTYGVGNGVYPQTYGGDCNGYGFSAEPNGWWTGAAFAVRQYQAFWWTSTIDPHDATRGIARNIVGTGSSDLLRITEPVGSGMGVRCVK